MTKDYDLGKGIAALFDNIKTSEMEAEGSRPPHLIPLRNLQPNPNQPRKTFADEDLSDLKKSIKEHGVLQPILVREVGDKYEIIAGERRFRAAQALDLIEIPAVVKNMSDADSMLIALIENIQRANLSPIEEAESLQQILTSRSCTQEELAKLIGKGRSYIANTLRLLTLPSEVQEMVKSGKLSAGHARTLVGKKEATELAKKAAETKMSVRELEKTVKDESTSIDIKNIESAIMKEVCLPTKVFLSPKGGRIEISFKNLEELETFIEKLYKQ